MIIETTVKPKLLELDKDSLDPAQLSMGALTREINLQQRPSFLLRFMMNALENKRQKKLLGWSRPWNKTGMMVFRSLKFDFNQDADFLKMMEDFFWQQSQGIPEEYKAFAQSLWQDPKKMVFIFFHNSSDGEKEYEGFTFSLGRKILDDKTKRDRIDIVFEDLRLNSSVDQKSDRIRIIVNPFDKWELGKKWEVELRNFEASDDLQICYHAGLEFYNEYRDNALRQWNHWAFRYIDYFGPRSFIPQGSAFL